jgi:hypothetical protein
VSRRGTPRLSAFALSGSAGAAKSSIEGVWSFGGGSVVIEPLPNGEFQGTVVSATTFARCPHTVGEVMWTGMTLQPDGSYWGFHHWYLGPNCTPDPTLGQTAWRVFENTEGIRYLKVCFSSPGESSQPTIAPAGNPTTTAEYPAYHVTYGCAESAALEPLSVTEAVGGIRFSKLVILPSAKACVKRQASLKITIEDPKYDPLEEVVVKLNGKKVTDVKGAKRVKRLKKGIITLKKLPSGTYKISVVATTVLKQRLTGSRTYHSCGKGSGKIKLKGSKTHHKG